MEKVAVQSGCVVPKNSPSSRFPFLRPLRVEADRCLEREPDVAGEHHVHVERAHGDLGQWDVDRHVDGQRRQSPLDQGHVLPQQELDDLEGVVEEGEIQAAVADARDHVARVHPVVGRRILGDLLHRGHAAAGQAADLAQVGRVERAGGGRQVRARVKREVAEVDPGAVVGESLYLRSEVDDRVQDRDRRIERRGVEIGARQVGRQRQQRVPLHGPEADLLGEVRDDRHVAVEEVEDRLDRPEDVVDIREDRPEDLAEEAAQVQRDVVQRDRRLALLAGAAANQWVIDRQVGADGGEARVHVDIGVQEQVDVGGGARVVAGREEAGAEVGQAEPVIAVGVGQGDPQRGIQACPRAGARLVGRGEVEEEELGVESRARREARRRREVELVPVGAGVQDEREPRGLVQGEAEMHVIAESQSHRPHRREVEAKAAELRVQRDRERIGPLELEGRIDLGAVRRQADVRRRREETAEGRFEQALDGRGRAGAQVRGRKVRHEGVQGGEHPGARVEIELADQRQVAE